MHQECPIPPFSGIQPLVQTSSTCGSMGGVASAEVSWGFFEGEVPQGWRNDSVTVVDEGIRETVDDLMCHMLKIGNFVSRRCFCG